MYFLFLHLLNLHFVAQKLSLGSVNFSLFFFFLIHFFFHCARYTFSSLESQIRVLGDYAFMLRDYELALSNYRLLSTDYKLDKAWKRYAGVQVFAIVCLVMCAMMRVCFDEIL